MTLQLPTATTNGTNSETLESFLESLGYSEFLPVLRALNVNSLEQLNRTSEDILTNAGIPLGPRKKMLSECAKIRIKEMLATKKDDIYFEHGFPSGSEARKMFGHGTAF